MEAVVGLLVILLGVSHGLETYCDGRKDGAQCFGALGGTVVIQLMDSASEIPRYEWKKGSAVILSGKENDIQRNAISSRSEFTPSTGIFRINDLSRTDSGEYTLTVFIADLQPTGKRTLHLSIQAPVSSLWLISECLQGQMRVSCTSVGGDSPQYSWTLDGRGLRDDELLSGTTESENITLNADVSGYLVCSVRNHFEGVCGSTFNYCTSSNGIQKWVHESNETECNTTYSTVTTDTSVDQSLLVCGLQAGGFILSIIAISIYFTCKKNKRKKAEASAVPQTTEYPEDSVVMVVM